MTVPASLRPVGLPRSPAPTVEALAARERMRRVAQLGVLSWATFGLVWGAVGARFMGLIHAATAATWFVALLVLRGGESDHRTRLSVHLTLGSGTLALLAAAHVTGQGAGVPLWYLVLVPFVGGLLGDRRAAIGWTLVATLGLVATHLLGRILVVPTEVEFTGTLVLLNQVLLIALTLLTAMALRSGTDAALRTVRDREATIEAQAAALTRSRDVAEAASRAKSEFLANMTHELRTPLNGLIGPVDLLRRTQLDDSQQETLAIIESSARALRSLVDTVLDFSKIEAGQMELRPTRARIHRAIHETLRIFDGMAESRGIALTKNIDRQVPVLLRLDVTRFQQTLLNLVGNAVKFTRDGHVSVDITYDRGPGTLRVRVQDTGIGIAEDALPHIFEAFRQGDGSSAREFGGTGLGLAICAHLVELAGGAITVQSEPGQGSRFEFTWPAQPIYDAMQSAQDLQALTGTQLRVLVAEDEPVNQKVITMMLTRLGVTPTLVDNGPEAVALATDHDVVFMDMRLPGMDGLDATRAIRAANAGRPPWIIAATANATEHDRTSCLDAGMNDFVAKPLQLTDLAAALERAAGGLSELEEGAPT